MLLSCGVESVVTGEEDNRNNKLKDSCVENYWGIHAKFVNDKSECESATIVYSHQTHTTTKTSMSNHFIRGIVNFVVSV